MTGFLRAAITGLVCLLGLAGGVGPSSAADYPNRPVRWLIGFTAGGPVDTVARIMAQWLSERFGQQFVVENRAGSGGNIAARREPVISPLHSHRVRCTRNVPSFRTSYVS